MDPQEFDRLWQQGQFGFSQSEEDDDLCIYAQRFALWADGLYQEEAERPTQMGVNQKMLLLAKKYFEWRTVVPKSHKDRIGERSHVCIFHIFERSYYRLKVLELSLNPPLLYLPPPPAAPTQVIREVSGVYLGEFLDDQT